MKKQPKSGYFMALCRKFAEILLAPSYYIGFGGKYPLAKELHSPELQEDLKAGAALKRERKAKKRVVDNFYCINNNPCKHWS